MKQEWIIQGHSVEPSVLSEGSIRGYNLSSGYFTSDQDEDLSVDINEAHRFDSYEEAFFKLFWHLECKFLCHTFRIWNKELLEKVESEVDEGYPNDFILPTVSQEKWKKYDSIPSNRTDLYNVLDGLSNNFKKEIEELKDELILKCEELIENRDSDIENLF